MIEMAGFNLNIDGGARELTGVKELKECLGLDSGIAGAIKKEHDDPASAKYGKLNTVEYVLDSSSKTETMDYLSKHANKIDQGTLQNHYKGNNEMLAHINRLYGSYRAPNISGINVNTVVI